MPSDGVFNGRAGTSQPTPYADSEGSRLITQISEQHTLLHTHTEHRGNAEALRTAHPRSLLLLLLGLLGFTVMTEKIGPV